MIHLSSTRAQFERCHMKSAKDDNQALWTSIQIWTGLLRTWNQVFLQQPFSYGVTSQCCPWQPEPKIIGTDLKRSASNLTLTVSATTICVCQTSQCCPLQQKHYDDRYWFAEVCFESETNGFCNNHYLIVKRLSFAHESKILGSSVLTWKSLLRVWNQWFLQQPFSHCDTSQCCQWPPTPVISGTD